jgi:predicted phosphodiesterase
MKRMQIISDIHLELYPHTQIPIFTKKILNGKGNCQYLALLGDIGNPMNDGYQDFIISLSDHYKKILVIAGNHEYYSGEPMEIINQKIEDVCNSRANIEFLNNKTTVLPNGQVVIGSTLWSHIPPEHAEEVNRKLNDYHQIHDFSIELNNELHERSVEFIQKELSQINANDNVVVLTHHSPLLNGTSYPKYENTPTNHAFSTDLLHLINHPINVWAFGHTHYQVDMMVNDVQILSNPIGYDYRNELEQYDQKIDYTKSVSLISLKH